MPQAVQGGAGAAPDRRRGFNKSGGRGPGGKPRQPLRERGEQDSRPPRSIYIPRQWEQKVHTL
jgi:hypothetical protein